MPGYEASGWCGVVAPKNTSIEIVDKLHKESEPALPICQFRAQLSNLGVTPLALSPTDFGKFIGDETEKWGKVVKFAGLKPE